ncbi:hypothetical protein KIH23_07985 [Flavobacterium sp. CYK-55]|uniref:hypothetical protein n=1 Tax=Flavobacterium sp. CYK-55 TaxID=2835529 RepID=UPI001BCCBD23|nr:hypothetical protein [Flavobacterium sp. CYK-55]MBS7787235.1 hypothetical protein [Flavobacterium sp. CYK-55]
MKTFLAFVFAVCLNFISLAQNKDVNGRKINPYNVHITGMDRFVAQKPQGSPYLNKAFSMAKIDDSELKFAVRYNAYSDEFEFLNSKNDTLVLDKTEAYPKIIFAGSNKKYLLLNYIDYTGKSYTGYLIEQYQKNNWAVLKRERISFYPGKKAKTSLENDMPAKYSKEKEVFYLKKPDATVVEFPESKKQLTKLFADKKEAIEAFIKEQKIDFEYDQNKIIDFLAQ